MNTMPRITSRAVTIQLCSGYLKEEAFEQREENNATSDQEGGSPRGKDLFVLAPVEPGPLDFSPEIIAANSPEGKFLFRLGQNSPGSLPVRVHSLSLTCRFAGSCPWSTSCILRMSYDRSGSAIFPWPAFVVAGR